MAGWIALSARPSLAAVAIAAPAIALLALGLAVGWPAFVPVGLIGLGAEYAFALRGDDGVDDRAPVVAAALLLIAELAYWSLEQRVRAHEEVALTLRRLWTLAAFVVGSLAVAAALVGLTRTTFGGGTALEAVGVAAAAGALAIVAVLARRST